jgi:tetratricopeptide (TPR) repeat protein
MAQIFTRFLLLAALAVIPLFSGSTLTPAELGIAEARKVIQANPHDANGYNSLSTALVHRAQETSDDSYYEQAAIAVRRSLELSPDNFEGLKSEVRVLLGMHDYSAALLHARILNKRTPDDLAMYGLLTDAYSALGDYVDAEPAAQWMLNLRPGNLAAFVNAAHLREIFGDMNGAYNALNLAYQGTASSEFVDQAKLLTEMARERRLAGQYEAAEKLANEARKAFPQYHRALEELANIYLGEKRYPEAIENFRRAYEAVPTARNSYSLASALELAGRTEEAARAYSDFLQKARSESGQKNNANLDLVFYYADHTHELSKALELAEKEHAERRDIYTLDAYAWALHRNGEDGEARKQMDTALAVGTRDPSILTHSAQIPNASVASVTK